MRLAHSLLLWLAHVQIFGGVRSPSNGGGASLARCAPGGVKGYYSLLQPCDIVLMLYLTGTWLPFLILPPQCLRPWAAGSPGTGTPCWRDLPGDHTQTWPTGSSRDLMLYCRQLAPGDFDEEVMCVHFMCVRWSKKKSWEVVRAIPCWPWKKQNGIIFSDMGVHSEQGGLSQYLYTERDIPPPPILTNNNRRQKIRSHYHSLSDPENPAIINNQTLWGIWWQEVRGNGMRLNSKLIVNPATVSPS